MYYSAVECPPGSFLSESRSECALCPSGTHQPNAGQSTCFPCPQHASYISIAGATSCDQIKKRISFATARCQVKCNPGFEHPSKPNIYEECEPFTGWAWSNELFNTALVACMGKREASCHHWTKFKLLLETYIGVSLELEVAYFNENSTALNSSQQKDIEQEFLSIVHEKKICTFDGEQRCNVTYTSTEKQSIQNRIFIKFKLEGAFSSTHICRQACIDKLDNDCFHDCRMNMTQQTEFVLETAADQVQTVFNKTNMPNDSSPIISYDGMTFTPMQGIIRHRPKHSCPSGMMMLDDNSTCGNSFTYTKSFYQSFALFHSWVSTWQLPIWE